MRHAKNGNKWHCSFQEEVKNVKLLMDDAQRRTKTNMAICHLSHPGDLKMK